jgi:hypothetical protein
MRSVVRWRDVDRIVVVYDEIVVRVRPAGSPYWFTRWIEVRRCP